MPRTGIDRTLAFCLFCLVGLGIVFVFSSSYYEGLMMHKDSTYYLLGHIKRLGIASFFFLIGLVVPFERITKYLLPLLALLIIALVVTLFMGSLQFGAKRSIVLSWFGLQASEFVRIWLVFFLANFFAAHPGTANSGKGLLVAMLLCVALILLVAIQPSISMALICLMTLVIMLVYGGVRPKLLLTTMGIGLVLLAILVAIFPHAQHRVIGFITHPTYQVQQSLIAIGSGGFFGKGPGAGLQKFLFLPRIHNDFIFAHVAEEVGFVGSLAVFFLYWQVFLRGLAIAGSMASEFARLLVLGLNASIFMIFLIHVGVSIGLLPPTGIPLPFISFGGWSISANLFAMGVILQASKWRII